MLAITNAGVDRTSICYEQRRHAERVLKGESDDETFYPVLYNAPDNADWTSPDSWRMANPSLGITILEEDLRTEFVKAVEEPALQPRFRRFYLSQWVQAATRWLDLEVWNRNKIEPIPEAELAGRECVVGVDASRYFDMTAVTAVFLATADLPAYILPRFYMPRPTIDRRTRAESTPFRQWADARLIEEIDGPAIDDDTIVAAVKEMAKRYTVLEVAFDPKAMTGSVQRLEKEGMVCVPVGQGFNLSDAAKAFHRRLLHSEMHHPGHPVLDWCAANIEVMTDREDHIRLVKPEDRTKNVDGISAAVTAMKRAALLESAEQEPTPQIVFL
jgi:phage terminase large subunit-like protein